MLQNLFHEVIDIIERILGCGNYNCSICYTKFPKDNEEIAWALNKFFGYQIWIIIIALYYFPYPETLLVLYCVPTLWKMIK